MQTLKTAAIVVLLMTIIYGAYVSLTTPPEPLPPEVENMLVMGEDEPFSIDAGLPESLGDMAIDSGSTADLSQPSVSEADAGLAALSAPSPAFTADLPVTGTLSDDSVSISGGAGLAPQPETGSAQADLATQGAYPTTGQTFAMPNPSAGDVKFQTASSVQPSLGMGMPDASPTWPGSQASAESPTPVANPAVAESTAVAASTPIASSTPGHEAAPSAAGTPTGSATAASVGVSNALRTADRQFQEEKLTEALTTLSLFYNTPNLTGQQRADLLSRLDPLAREVIYSKRHLLEQPYRVGQTETLMQVAKEYQVPWQLLANINQINDPITVLPGTELKVVRGPFRADVDLERKELTLFLGDLYAGRFPIAVGTDPAPRPGTFTIQDKQKSRTFYDAAGSPIPPESPNNPYGNAWMDLGGQLCIHGSPSTTTASEQGCISLAGDYAEDLYGILSQGSSVTIRR